MKFTIKKTLLDNIVEFLSKYSNPIDTFVTFRYILIDVEEEKITFTASNSTMSARKVVPVDEIDIKVEDIGSSLINCSYFKNIIKKLNKTIEISTQNDLINIVEGNTIYKLNTISNNFPKIDFSDTSNKFELNKSDFEKAVKNVIFAVGDNLNSIILKCVNIICDGTNLRFTATDTARLSTEIIKINKNIKINVSIDSKNIRNMIIKDSPKKIFMFFDNTKLGISYENTIIQTSIVDIPYHDISKVFPKDYTRKIIIEKDELMNIINKVVFINQEKGSRLELKINEKELKITTNISEIGTSFASTKNFTLEGEPIEIDFNHIFLKEAINIIEGEINIFINENGNVALIVSKTNPNNKQLLSSLRRI